MTSRNAQWSAEEKATLIGLFVSFLGPFLVRAISRHSAVTFDTLN